VEGRNPEEEAGISHKEPPGPRLPFPQLNSGIKGRNEQGQVGRGEDGDEGDFIPGKKIG